MSFTQLTFCCLLLCGACSLAQARVRDPCQVLPSTSSICMPSTLNIHYDPETQRCKFMGCGQKKLFATLEDCDKICNNKRHRNRRLNANKQNDTNEY